jgi:hypothetical protein
MVIYPDEAQTEDDDDGLEYKQIMSKAKKKASVQAVLNKRYVTEEELDSVFLGE